MTLREKIEVMQAFERGEEIEQCERLYDKWYESPLPAWNWNSFLYRIKPKQKKVVVLETWLCETDGRYEVRESSNIKAYVNGYWKTVKLLSTREVEL